MPKKLTDNQLFELIKIHHGDIYSYEDCAYVSDNKKIKIKCRYHGVFLQLPLVHAEGGAKCPKCEYWEEVALKLPEIHANKYDYQHIIFHSFDQVLSLKCVDHGEFKVSLEYHRKGSGCPYCRGYINTNQKWVKDFKEIHGDLYTYEFLKAETRSRDKVAIFCKMHGRFEQTVNNHKKGQICPTCAIDVRKMSAKLVIEKRKMQKISTSIRRRSVVYEIKV